MSERNKYWENMFGTKAIKYGDGSLVPDGFEDEMDTPRGTMDQWVSNILIKDEPEAIIDGLTLDELRKVNMSGSKKRSPRIGEKCTFIRVSETGSHSCAITTVWNGKDWVIAELDEVIAEVLRYNKIEW